MTTIKDIAEHAGVSFKTVSRVINGVPTVSRELSERVQASIAALNYVPNQSARRLRGTASTVAFVYDNPNSHYVVELQEGIIGACRQRNFEVMIHPGCGDAAADRRDVENLARRADVGGLILTPPLSEDDSFVKRLAEAGIDLVRIVSGTPSPDPAIPTVHVNDRQAAFELVAHLLALGHERIAFLEGDAVHRSTLERRKGYEQALRRYRRPVDRSLIVPGEYTFSSGAERLESLLAKGPDVSAIVACNDEIAAGVLFATRCAGLEIPRDLSIVGFEDSPFSRQSWPRLSTARQSNRELGAQAASLLVGQIARAPDREKPPCSVGITPEVVLRESTAAPGAGTAAK